MRRRSWLTQQHTDMSISETFPDPETGPRRALQLPSEYGRRNLLLATHWLPRVWWLCWGQVEVRIG